MDIIVNFKTFVRQISTINTKFCTNKYILNILYKCIVMNIKSIVLTFIFHN